MKCVSARAFLVPAAIAGLLNMSATSSVVAQQAASAAAIHNTTSSDSNQAASRFRGSGSGQLMAMVGSTGKELGQCPLKHTDVSAKISGYMARVTVKQVFHNPFKDKIEAVYTFPLSETGAVDDMKMTIGKRVIKGIIKKREEAREIYENARRHGQTAALLDQERPNIFTQSVANIMPGESIEVTLQYVDLLPYEAGRFSFAFPTVVGPRFNPGQPIGRQGTGWDFDRTQVPDASRITPPVAKERAGHDISIAVSIDSGVPIHGLVSRLHEVTVQQPDAVHAQVQLKNLSAIPNKDFVLTWDVAGDQLKSGYLAYRPAADKPGYFTMMILPPKRPTLEHIQPKEMIYVIDCSGSQHGKPLDKAKETMRYVIDHMNPEDTFQVIAFNNGASKLFETPQKGSPEMKRQALQYINRLEANGGTWMQPAVEAACSTPRDKNRLRIVTFMTDGYVGNDFQILGLVEKLRGDSRWFPFGTGNSVNRFLIDGMAKEGGGEAEYVLLNSSGDEAGKKFYQRISSPVLTDVKLDFDGLEVKEVFPHNVADVWAERPLYIKGRYIKPGAGTVTISGFSGGQPYKQSLKVKFPELSKDNAVLGSIWARAKVDRLMSEDWESAQQGSVNKELKDEIVRVALDHHIMTQYTSFVAVEEKPSTDGKPPRLVPVEVEMPDGVSREHVFGKQDMGRIMQASRSKSGAGGSGFYAARRLGPATRLDSFQMSWSAPPVPGSGYGAAAGAGGGMAPSAPPPPPPLHEAEVFEGNRKVVSSVGQAPEPPRHDEAGTIGKLNKVLAELSGNMARLGKNFTFQGIQVSDGRVKVLVELSENTPEVQKRLRLVGLEILVQSPGKLTVTGRIEVEKLDDLALLKFVKLIKPSP